MDDYLKVSLLCICTVVTTLNMVSCAQLPVLAALGGTNTTWFLPWNGRNTVRVCGDLARRYLPRQSFSEAPLGLSSKRGLLTRQSLHSSQPPCRKAASAPAEANAPPLSAPERERQENEKEEQEQQGQREEDEQEKQAKQRQKQRSRSGKGGPAAGWGSRGTRARRRSTGPPPRASSARSQSPPAAPSPVHITTTHSASFSLPA